MTHRTHFWIRILSLAIIVAAQCGPRLLAGATDGASRVAAAAVAR